MIVAPLRQVRYGTGKTGRLKTPAAAPKASPACPGAVSGLRASYSGRFRPGERIACIAAGQGVEAQGLTRGQPIVTSGATPAAQAGHPGQTLTGAPAGERPRLPGTPAGVSETGPANHRDRLVGPSVRRRTQVEQTMTRGRVRIEHGRNCVRACLGGELAADTTSPLLVWEVPYYPACHVSRPGTRGARSGGPAHDSFSARAKPPANTARSPRKAQSAGKHRRPGKATRIRCRRRLAPSQRPSSTTRQRPARPPLMPDRSCADVNTSR